MAVCVGWGARVITKTCFLVVVGLLAGMPTNAVANETTWECRMDDEDLGTADVRISPDEAIYVYSGDDFGYVERYICEGDVCVLELEAYEGTRSFAVSQIERDETGVPSEIRDVHFEVTLDEVTSINDYRNEPVELLECSALVLEQ